MSDLMVVAARVRGAMKIFLESCATRFKEAMRFRNTRVAWGALSKSLHWLVVFLIIAQWIIARYAAAQTFAGKVAPLSLHKSIGMSILAVTVFRLIWRLINPGPSSFDELRSWERGLARISHILLYAFVIALPITGWLMSSARNFPVSWFGMFQFPDLVSPDRVLFQRMEDFHDALFVALVAVALLHISGALKHHFVDRNNILLRMLPARTEGRPGGLDRDPE